jgi:hypothetical protein
LFTVVRSSGVPTATRRFSRVPLPSTVACFLISVTLTGPAVAANPWALRCKVMPVEQSAPQPAAAAARRFYPWVGKNAADALHDGPVYLFALSIRTAISRDGDRRDADEYYLHRALIAVSPSYSRAVTIVGARLGHPGPRTRVGFSTNGANHCTVSPPNVNCGNRSHRFAPQLTIAPRRGWRIVETELRIGRTGCFRLTATGVKLNVRIPLSVPGPDWGTPDW